MYTLWWVSPDEQGSLNMGTFDTYEAAEADIPSAQAELLDQAPGPAGSEEHTAYCADVGGGRWSIEKTEA